MLALDAEPAGATDWLSHATPPSPAARAKRRAQSDFMTSTSDSDRWFVLRNIGGLADQEPANRRCAGNAARAFRGCQAGRGTRYLAAGNRATETCLEPPRVSGYRPGWWVAAALTVLAGCGEPGPIEPLPPVITVQGVHDGLISNDPVTITISVDRGGFEARLNGDLFVSGTTVSAPADYELVVTARAGVDTARTEIGFEIALTGSSLLIVRVIDLGANDAGGGGDAILVTDSSAAGMVHALIDAGPAGVGASDPGFVARRLAQLGIDSLAFLLLTHAHGDHFGGMIPVLDGSGVGTFYYNGQARNLTAYQDVLARAQARADSVHVVNALIERSLGYDTAVTVATVLSPLPDSIGASSAGSTGLNDGSLAVRLRRGSFEMLLTGDGQVRANQRWRTTFPAYTQDVDVLKVGHHGADNAVFDNGCCGASAWLAHTAPAVAIISANGTSHPRTNAVGALLGRPGLRTLCTNTHGTVEIRVNPAGAYRVDVARNPAAACSAGSTP
jgi:beta-lactamase superfamily II metal-dependent hydrolase